jgi:Ca-activated chloride channel family protein
MRSLAFLDPWLLALAIVVPLALLLRRRRGEPAVAFAPAPLAEGLPGTWRTRLVHLPRVLQVAGILTGIVALARPVHRAEVPVATEGIEILLCLDTSSSMSARDLDPARTRLDVAKDAAARFIAERSGDRIGLMCFARYPDLRCPPTLDHAALASILSEVAMVPRNHPEDATGIGTAVALAAKVLRAKESRSKVVIVLTDGEENVATAQTPNEIAPLHAAQLCKELGVRVYAIAVGQKGGAAPDGRLSVDTGQVLRMAERCDGALFEAADAAALADVYERIDRLETSGIAETRIEAEDRFLPFLAVAVALFLAGRVLGSTVLEVLP